MSITKIQTSGIPDLAVTHDKLHTDMDLSTKTVTLPTLSTLNTTGNVLVGTVDTNVANNSGSGNDGVNIHPDSIRIARTDSDTLLLNRLNSDGDIIKFLKDGAAVGIVGTVGSDLTIGTGDVALRFQDGSDNLVPHNISTNSTRDGGINIGTTGARFKALHLSGTVNAVQLDITAGTDAKMYTSNAISEVGTGTFAMQSVNSAGSALRPLGFRASDIRFATGSSERMRIDNSGNVGIGTDAPARPLNIVNDAGSNPIQSIRNSSLAWSQYALTRYGTEGEDVRYMDFGYYRGSGEPSRGLVIKSQANATLVTFLDSGNVGIGISPTHLLHVQAGSTGNGDVKIGGGAGLLISHNNSGHTVQTIKSLYHATSASSNLRIVTGFLTVSTGTSDTERLRLKSNGSFEIGYAGAALQQADNQAMTITTPASGGGQGIAIKRLDSNSDQQIGEITFSNNTQDGQAGIRVKTQGAVNTTDMHFDVNNSGGAVTSALKIDGSQGGKISIVSREMSIQGMELRHGTFGIGNYNRRVEIQLGNYESAHVRIMAQRTNGGSCLVYWEGYINNNNNAGYSTTIASRTSDGSVSYSFSVSGGNYRWDFNASGSSGDGSFVVQGARGGGSINITTW